MHVHVLQMSRYIIDAVWRGKPLALEVINSFHHCLFQVSSCFHCNVVLDLKRLWSSFLRNETHSDNSLSYKCHWLVVAELLSKDTSEKSPSFLRLDIFFSHFIQIYVCLCVLLCYWFLIAFVIIIIIWIISFISCTFSPSLLPPPFFLHAHFLLLYVTLYFALFTYKA